MKNRNKLFFYICACVFLIGILMTINVFVSKWLDDEKLAKQQIYLDQMKEDIPDISKPTEEIVMMSEYKILYEENDDLIGWLKIENTVIDYPVMQTPEDENYYLYRGFDKKDNQNGSLIMDTDSVVGVGNLENQYSGGISPSTNLIIHGHTMKSGQMFGNLMLGDEFITLSCCSYHVEDGRFVVVGKRIK